MTDDRSVLRHTFRVGRFTCELIVPVLGPGVVAMATAEWTPSVPVSLAPSERAIYETELARALAQAIDYGMNR
ncbi:MAG: hypothetical protein WCY29_15795 [Novosphingobium sp.]